jgi:hypothetical protein
VRWSSARVGFTDEACRRAGKLAHETEKTARNAVSTRR